MAATPPAKARKPIARRLMPEMSEEGWVEAGVPRSEAGMGGIAAIWSVVVDALSLGATAAPCAPCCTCEEFGEAAEEVEPTAYGISGDCVWALKTMLRLVWGGMSSSDALRYT